MSFFSADSARGNHRLVFLKPGYSADLVRKIDDQADENQQSKVKIIPGSHAANWDKALILERLELL